MGFLDFLIYTLAVLVSGALSIPFSAMIVRKKPILVFLLPIVLGILSLIFFILYWTNIDQGKLFYYLWGLYSLLAAVGAVIGAIFIIIRKHYKI